VWVVTNRKAAARSGKVQLIDATSMRKSLGDKRREIPLERAQDILKILADFRDGDMRTATKDGKEEEVVVSRIFPTTHFGFRKITVERPLRLELQASPERIERAFFDREVKPHVPDAWIETSKRDPKDGWVGLVGYEINFNRYFYRYKPPRPLEEIEADLRDIEVDIVRMLSEVTGTGGKG